MFGGLLLLRVRWDPLFEEGKKEARKGTTKETLDFPSCGAEPQPGK